MDLTDEIRRINTGRLRREREEACQYQRRLQSVKEHSPMVRKILEEFDQTIGVKEIRIEEFENLTCRHPRYHWSLERLGEEYYSVTLWFGGEDLDAPGEFTVSARRRGWDHWPIIFTDDFDDKDPLSEKSLRKALDKAHRIVTLGNESK